jgi:IS5 family transposase
MIEVRRLQCSFAEGLIRETVEDLWEEWMRHVDTVLEDESLLSTVYEALARRRPKSRTRGRLGTPAEVVLRMLLLKHLRNWSFDELEREVRSNLVYREFTRAGGEKVPDAKTLGRLARALGPQVVATIHERIVAIASEQRVIQGRKLRVDTTVDVATLCYTSLSL